MVAAEPEATASAAVPPSSAAMRCSKTSVVGFTIRVYVCPNSFTKLSR